eukprot:13078459-Alexandrium_andersonii.AAC.1
MGRSKSSDDVERARMVEHLRKFMGSPDSFFYESKMKNSPVSPKALLQHRELISGILQASGRKNVTQSTMEAVLGEVYVSGWRVDKNEWVATMSARLRTALYQVCSALGRPKIPHWADPFHTDLGGAVKDDSQANTANTQTGIDGVEEGEEEELEEDKEEDPEEE